MDVTALAQVLTMVLAAAAIVWHQQRSTDKLRAEMRAEIAGLRGEMRVEIGGLRSEMRAEIGELRSEVAVISQRLARIEGYLGIDMPEPAAAAAAGAAVRSGAAVGADAPAP